MRIGTNPQKDQHQSATDCYHQVVVPVYIPDSGDYFKDSKSILELCLTSLFKTAHPNTFITVVNNGSGAAVSAYLQELYERNQIHELIQTTNIGKINALFKGMMGHSFPIVTFTDADVLFCNGWQQASYTLFETFPKTGFVSTTPIPKLWKYHTANVLKEFRNSAQLQFRSVVAPEALDRFAQSIENPNFYAPVHKEKQLVLEKEGVQAVVGAGHFVATYRRAAFEGYESPNSKFALGGKEVRYFLDAPVYKNGFWRLATATNLSYHMGNTLEPWMTELVENLEDDSSIPQLSKEMQTQPVLTPPGTATKIFEKLFHRPAFWKSFAKRKGLTAEEANDY